MENVARFYQIAVVLNDEDKRMLVAMRDENGKTVPVLDISGEEATTRYHCLLDLLDRPPTKN